MGYDSRFNYAAYPCSDFSQKSAKQEDINNILVTKGKENNIVVRLKGGDPFVGLISAFVARAIAGKGDAHIIGDGAGILSITALISSVILMLIMQKLAGLEKLKWLESFAMPFAMIGAMAIVMIMAQILPADVAFLEWRG